MFIKVKGRYGGCDEQEMIINTNEITRICRGYDGEISVLFNNGEVRLSDEEAKKIFNAIGVSL